MHILAHHLEEFTKSGISPEIATTVFRSVSSPQKIASFLGWKYYKGPCGWIYEGIDVNTGINTGIGQLKPDEPIFFPNSLKPAKYLTQKRGWDATAVAIPGIDYLASEIIYVTEGIKKAVCLMLNSGIPCLSLSGVDMGFDKDKNLVSTLLALATLGKKFELIFDADLHRKKEVRLALSKLAGRLQSAGCEATIRTWDESIGKGVDDAIVAIGWEKFLENSVVMELEEWRDSFSLKKKRPPEQSVMAEKIAKLWGDRLAWRPNIQKWYKYGAEIDGIWSKEPEELIGKLIALELAAEEIEFSAGYLSGILKLIKIHLTTKTWDEIPGFIPAQNGVLDIETLELLPHSPSRKLTWCLPYNYDKKAQCEPILQWLREAVSGNESVVQLLRAYLAAILRERSDLHGFIEIQGPGGSGKGTFLQLAKALVGARNTHTTRLKTLENGRFEPAAMFDKKLILIDDSDKYQGSVEILKSLTGGGAIPYEEKNIQQGDREDVVCNAKVLIACNEAIQSADYTSGLQRRRINVPFLNQIQKKDQRTLLGEKNHELTGEFVEFLPGLLNWVLAINNETIENYLRKTEEFVIGHRQLQLDSILQTNPIADWADYCLIYEVGSRLQIGVAQPNRGGGENSYLNVGSWAYASYREYCINVGIAKDRIISLRRFVPLMKDLFLNQLKLAINHCRDRVCSFFENLKIRTEFDESPSLINSLAPPEVPAPVPPKIAPEVPAPVPPKIAPEVPASVPPKIAAEVPASVPPNWAEFPSAVTDSTENRKNKALACLRQLKKEIVTAKCRKDMAAARGRWTAEEANWVSRFLLTPEERRRLQAILATDQKELDL